MSLGISQQRKHSEINLSLKTISFLGHVLSQRFEIWLVICWVKTTVKQNKNQSDYGKDGVKYNFSILK